MEIYLSPWILLLLPSWIIFLLTLPEGLSKPQMKTKSSINISGLKTKKRKHCFIDEIVAIELSATQIPLSIFTSWFHKRCEKHSMLESTLELLQQFYIQMEIEPDEFHHFPGDSSLCTLRCMRCRKPVTVAGSIGETLLHAPTAILYHGNMI